MRSDRANLLLARLVGLLVLALAAGCETLPTIDVPREVRVEVPVPCLPATGTPARPATAREPELMALDTYRRTLAAWRDLKRLEAYTAELEAVLEGCRRLPAANPP